MIRVVKSPNAPLSLLNTNDYDGDDVQEQLAKDQYRKCYLCERKRVTDYEIEHLRSEHNYPALRQEWTNLFYGCKYCNGRKSSSYDDILNPTSCNIEEEIIQEIDYGAKKAVFSTHVSETAYQKTVKLLQRIHNGKEGIRIKREEFFFEYLYGAINHFKQMVLDYLLNPTAENALCVSEELGIEKEFLGFKYWIIMKNDILRQRFGGEVKWNKR